MQMSGGHLLVAGPDSGNSSIFFPTGKENATRVQSPYQYYLAPPQDALIKRIAVFYE
jgi:hypothetical protein